MPEVVDRFPAGENSAGSTPKFEGPKSYLSQQERFRNKKFSLYLKVRGRNKISKAD